LHIAMDCGRGSLVKICGLRGIKFYDLHTSVDATWLRRQPRSCLAVHPLLRQLEQGGWSDVDWESTNQTTWVASDVTDTELKLVLQCYLSVLDSAAAPCRRPNRLSITLIRYVRLVCRLPESNTHARRALLYDIIRSPGDAISQGRRSISWYCVIDTNPTLGLGTAILGLGLVGAGFGLGLVTAGLDYLYLYLLLQPSRLR